MKAMQAMTDMLDSIIFHGSELHPLCQRDLVFSIVFSTEIIIIIIIWFGDTVTVTHPTKCNTNSKVLTFVDHGLCPSYLAEDCILLSATRGRQHLRSAGRLELLVPRTEEHEL